MKISNEERMRMAWQLIMSWEPKMAVGSVKKESLDEFVSSAYKLVDAVIEKGNK